MTDHALRNIVITALGQVIVVTLGMLAAGVCFKWYVTFGVPPPPATVLVSKVGFVLLVVPLAWVTAALLVQCRDETPDTKRVAALASGGLVLLLLLVGVWYSAVGPWLRLLHGFH